MPSDDDFAEFFAATWPRMFRTALALVGDAAAAEDALQSAYAKAFASWRRIASANHPEAYVRRMVVNEIVSSRRHGWWRRERPHESVEPAATVGVARAPGRRPRRAVARGPAAAAASARGDRAALLRRPLRARDRRRARLQPGDREVPGRRGPRQPTPPRSAPGRSGRMTSTDLRQALENDLAAVVPPPGDLDRAVREGRRIRRRRRTRRGGGRAVAVAVAAVVTSAAHPWLHGPGPAPGRADRPAGLLRGPAGVRRARGRDPPRRTGVPGRPDCSSSTPTRRRRRTACCSTTPASRGCSTSPGKVTDLEPGAETGSSHFTSKVDSQGPLVAYAAVRDGQPTVTVRDLATDDVVARHDISRDTVIDGLDDGVVFLRTPDGTTTWDSRTGRRAGARRQGTPGWPTSATG